MSRTQDRKDDQLRELISPLWTEAGHGTRLAVLRELESQQLDMADIRVAQPALAAAIADPDVQISRLAAKLTCGRAEDGADIRLAVPALALAAGHPDTQTRQLVWRALHYADDRAGAMLAQVADLARRHAQDPDGQVREYAAQVLTRIGQPPAG